MVNIDGDNNCKLDERKLKELTAGMGSIVPHPRYSRPLESSLRLKPSGERADAACRSLQSAKRLPFGNARKRLAE